MVDNGLLQVLDRAGDYIERAMYEEPDKVQSASAVNSCRGRSFGSKLLPFRPICNSFELTLRKRGNGSREASSAVEGGREGGSDWQVQKAQLIGCLVLEPFRSWIPVIRTFSQETHPACLSLLYKLNAQLFCLAVDHDEIG